MIDDKRSVAAPQQQPRDSQLPPQPAIQVLARLWRGASTEGIALDGLTPEVRCIAEAMLRTNGAGDRRHAFSQAVAKTSLNSGELKLAMLKADDIVAAAAVTLTQPAADLLARQIPMPRWAIPGLIPEGESVLAGRPKFGKSWVGLQLCVAVGCGGRALSQIPVEQGEALFLGLEDTERRMQDRLRLLLGDQACPSGLHVPTDPRQWRRLDDGGLDQLDTWLTQHPSTRLVVLDTWAKIRPRTKRGADVYQESYDAAGQLKALADARHVAIVAIHHARKSLAGAVEDFVDTVLGDTGLTAAADTILVLQRVRGERDAVLYGTGRDVSQDLEEGRALKWDDMTGWSLQGSAADFRQTTEQRRIIELLRQHGKPLTPTTAAPLLGKTRDPVRQLMYQMSVKGLLTADEGGRGLYGLPEWRESRLPWQ